MTWNPAALISYSKLPASVKFDIIEHVAHDEINQRYFTDLQIKVGGFGENYVDFAGYKIQIKLVRVEDAYDNFRAYF